MAARGNKEDRQIFLTCYDLLLFGIPDRGLHIQALASMVNGRPNSILVNDLDTTSKCLHHLHQEFCDHFKFEDSPIVSIYETRLVRIVVVIDRHPPPPPSPSTPRSTGIASTLGASWTWGIGKDWPPSFDGA